MKIYNWKLALWLLVPLYGTCLAYGEDESLKNIAYQQSQNVANVIAGNAGPMFDFMMIQADIDQNKMDIAALQAATMTNATNIATNTANNTTNATDITTLESRFATPDYTMTGSVLEQQVRTNRDDINNFQLLDASMDTVPAAVTELQGIFNGPTLDGSSGSAFENAVGTNITNIAANTAAITNLQTSGLAANTIGVVTLAQALSSRYLNKSIIFSSDVTLNGSNNLSTASADTTDTKASRIFYEADCSVVAGSQDITFTGVTKTAYYTTSGPGLVEYELNDSCTVDLVP